MRRHAALKALRCTDNALCCHSRTRCRPPTCCYHHQTIRRFGSTGAQLNTESARPAPQNNGADQSKPSKPKSSGWGTTPTFGRASSLTAEELKLRDSLVAAQRARYQPDARESRHRAWNDTGSQWGSHFSDAPKSRQKSDERPVGHGPPARGQPRMTKGSSPQPSNRPWNPRMNHPAHKEEEQHQQEGYGSRNRPERRSSGIRTIRPVQDYKQGDPRSRPQSAWPTQQHTPSPNNQFQRATDQSSTPGTSQPGQRSGQSDFERGIRRPWTPHQSSATSAPSPSEPPKHSDSHSQSEYARPTAQQPRQEFDPQAYREPRFTGFRRLVPEREPEPIERRPDDREDAKPREGAIQPGVIIEEPVDEVEEQGVDRSERKPDAVVRKKSKKARQKKGFEDEDGEIHGFEEEEGFDEWRSRRKSKKSKSKEMAMKPTPIMLPDFISVTNLADALNVRQETFLRRIRGMGFEEATFDHILDAETAGLIASEFNFEATFDTGADDLVAAPTPTDSSVLSPRPPVVTIMGHVDHGKTTILDWLRKSSVVASEHGGITQHIGAFSVMMPSGKLITFLDTPGHAAFLDMRRRGADITDIVILVVAGDDSVKPQTIEAIKHAKQSQVPVIVAINKVDKPDVNIQRVKQDLARHNVNVEDFGGDVQAVPVSGKTGMGMVELEEAALTLSEMLDFRADPVGNVEGWVIEAATKKGGRVATVLVRRGTLRPGDVVVAGKTWARVRSLKNEAGVQVKEAVPGTPVSVDGWKEQPIAGDEVLQAEDMQQAKDVVELRKEKEGMQKLGGDMAEINDARRHEREKRERQRAAEEDDLALDDQAAEETGPNVIPVIVKADVSGSVEAIVNSVSSVGNQEVHAKILRSGVGPVGEFDIKHAATAKGVIVTFNQQTDPDISKQAITGGVEILNHTIIYELIDDIKARLSDRLPPSITHRVLGEAEIAQRFEISLKRRQKALIAGSKVKNGLIGRAHRVKVFRGDEMIYNGTLSSLKNVKKDVDEMRKGTECGIEFENWSDFQVGDHIQTYEEISEKRTL